MQRVGFCELKGKKNLGKMGNNLENLDEGESPLWEWAPFGRAEGKWGFDWKIGSGFVGALKKEEARMRGMGQTGGRGLKDGRRPRCGVGARTGMAGVFLR